MAAVSHALQVLSWMELDEKDRPPERIWLQPKALDAHFETVRARHEAKSQGMEPIDEQAPMLQNPLTEGLRR